MLEFLPHVQRWLNLCRIAPALKKLEPTSRYEYPPPPRRLSNGAFLQLAACFDDPLTRAALRQLIVNLLNDNDPVTKAAFRDLVLKSIEDDLAALLIQVLNQRNP